MNNNSPERELSGRLGLPRTFFELSRGAVPDCRLGCRVPDLHRPNDERVCLRGHLIVHHVNNVANGISAIEQNGRALDFADYQFLFLALFLFPFCFVYLFTYIVD